MSTAYTLEAVQSAAVKSVNPNTNYNDDENNRIYNASTVNENTLWSFTIPTGLRLKTLVLNSASIDIYINSKSQTPASSTDYINIYVLNSSWNENTVTYNNSPGLSLGLGGTSWGNIPASGRLSKALDWLTLAQLLTLFSNGLGCYAVSAGSCEVNMGMSRSSNKPRLLVTANSVSLVIGNQLPSSGFVYAAAEKTFSWTATQSASDITIDPVVQASAKLRYRIVGAGSYTEISISGATNSYNMPADTFDGGENYEWQVAVTSNDSVETVSSWLQFTTTDATPDPPTLNSPKNEYVQTDQDAVFSWTHIINTNTPQSAADLQYSYDGGAWTTLATVADSSQTVTVPADTLPAGSLRWRARTYNTDGVAGEWSEPVTFGGVGTPADAVFDTLPTSSRPVVSWQSVGQVGYQLVLLDSEGETLYDTGETAGAVKTLTLPLYLPNATYTVKLRIINASLLWSDYAQTDFTLRVTPPDKPTISAEAITDGAEITVSGIDVDAAYVYLLRDGVVIADITGLSTYKDYAAVGETEYVARVVDTSENYADSDPATVIVSVAPGAVIAAVDDLDNIIRMTQKAAGQSPVTRQKQYVGTGHHWAGREHQVFAFSEFANEVFNPSYFFTDFEDWEALCALADLRITVLYRDMMGNKFYGVVTANNSTQDEDKVTFVLSMQRVDYVEEIDYAEAQT